MLTSLSENKEEYSELCAEMKNEMTADLKFQEKIAGIKAVITQAIEEELAKIYGN